MSVAVVNWKCSHCGLWNHPSGETCRRCRSGHLEQIQANPFQQVQTAPGAYLTYPMERVNRGGKTCPRCGVTNSRSSMNGLAIILIVIMLVSIVGLVLIPFLPKTWSCRHCSYTW